MLAGMDPVALRLMAGGGSVFGLAWVAVGAGIISHQRNFRRRALTAQGVITGIRKVWTGGHGNPDGSLVYRPTVRFTTMDGRAVEGETRKGSNPSPGRPGKPVTVYYDPADPWRFTIDSLDRMSGCVASAFIALGGLVLLIAAAVLIGTAR
jgi:hypothetical protein